MTIKTMIKYRAYWMGFAMLWIVFYHIPIQYEGILARLKEISYGGVDIFLFASGVGNYYSYFRDCNPLEFIKRRITKLALPWLPFIVIWLAVNLAVRKITPLSIIGNLFGIQGFTSNGGEFNWYITAILICYLLTPYFAALARKNTMKQNAIFIAFLIAISFAFWNDEAMIITVTRLPIYYIGMVFAKNEDKRISARWSGFMAVLFILGVALLGVFFKFCRSMLWSFGLHWYPYIFITPFLCLLISTVVYRVEKKRIISKLCNPIFRLVQTIGKSSFEIYLIHAFLFDLEKRFVRESNLMYRNIISLGVAVVSIIIGVGYNRLLKIVNEKATRRRLNRKKERTEIPCSDQ